MEKSVKLCTGEKKMLKNLYQDWEIEILKARFKDKKTYAEIVEMFSERFDGQSQKAVARKVKDLCDDFLSRMVEIAGENTAKPDSTVQKTLDGKDARIPQKTEESVSFNAKTGESVFESTIAILQGEKITPEIVMQAHNLKPSEWEVVNFKSNCWQAQAPKNEKMALWQSKITVKPRAKQPISLEDTGKFFKKLALKYQPKYLEPIATEHNDLMREINISDLHYGKLAWVGESGENYDYKIAKKRFDSIIDQECARLEKEPVEKILFAWTNDFFNSDTPDNTTTAGTQQATDLRWQKMFNTGTEAIISAIDRLQQYAPVKTFYIASNHSRQMEFYATKVLEAWFNNNTRVEIDADGRARHYELFGKNMIGFTHSSFEKPANLQHLMAVEEPKMWANSTYREMHLAHIHSEKVEEKGGVVYRWLPSVTGADGWHYDSGYVGARKCSYSFLWDKHDGLQEINVTNIHDKKRTKTQEMEQ